MASEGSSGQGRAGQGRAGQGRAGQASGEHVRAQQLQDRQNGLSSRNMQRKAQLLPETFLLECWVVCFDPAPLGFPPRQHPSGLLNEKGECGSFDV